MLQKEKSILEGLISDLDYDLSTLQEWNKAETLEAFRDSLGQNYYHENRKFEVYQYQDELIEWLGEICAQPRRKNKADLLEVKSGIEKLRKLAGQRLVEIEQPITEMEATETAIALSEATSKQLQPSELFDKYQSNISRELHKAIDRLEAIRQQRNQAVSMGSFSQSDRE